MKRVVRSFLLFLCTTLFIMSASVCVCVVRVHADDTATYYQLSANECLTEQNNRTIETSQDVRGITFKVGTSYKHALCSLNQFTFGTGFQSCPSTLTVSSVGTTSGDITFYTNNSSSFSWNSSATYPSFPVVELNSRNDYTYENIYYYTFGDGAVDPVVPVNWGLVDLEGYQTNIAGQGNASINNVDVISWNDTFDTNSNDITEGNVRIRFVPGEYRASSKSNLLQQTYNDFVLSIIDATAGNVFPVTDGSASFSWAEVIDVLRIPFWSIYNITNTTEGWLKRGWIYQVRLEIDDYIGEWQTVYASTSSGVENDLTIVNTTVITQETITAIQNINSINSTTNIWIINGTPVDPSPEYEPPASDDEKPWWAYLLEMINNTLGIQNQYINEGTDESIEIVNNFEDDHDDLNVTVNDYDDIENNIVDDMNNNIDDLDIESDLIENNSFLSSARWVAEQYTRITTDNPIGSILKFSLVLGFVMIFLGRFK